MPRRKKNANEMTDEEILRRVFPKRVVDELKKQVAEPVAMPLPDSESPDKTQITGA